MYPHQNRAPEPLLHFFVAVPEEASDTHPKEGGAQRLRSNSSTVQREREREMPLLTSRQWKTPTCTPVRFASNVQRSTATAASKPSFQTEGNARGRSSYRPSKQPPGPPPRSRTRQAPRRVSRRPRSRRSTHAEQHVPSMKEMATTMKSCQGAT